MIKEKEICITSIWDNPNATRTQNEESTAFQTEIALKEGCLKPLLFLVVIHKEMKETIKMNK